MTRPHRRLAAALALVLAGAAAVLGAPVPAAAHDGPGILTMESDTPTGTSHHFVIRLVWENDGHPAARDTTVTLTPTAPSGTAGTPVPMTPVDDDGRFEATVDLAEPGNWKVRFTSLRPESNVEVDVQVTPPATTTTAPATTTTTVAPDTEPDDADEVDAEEASSTDDPGSDSDSGGGVLLVAVLVVVALAAAGALAVVYRSRRGTTAGDPGDDTTPPDVEA
ncbi:MAG TPA: hypothetical protein VIL36_02730 [Acidimicrobiales bacterium]